ncbi:hypothetical protein CNMCM7691_010080 [Aspergillus felis]|uniref:3-carboxymuconate cyclase n=1 Tax=Aspergillus felis TaxID=1287682 RepID=A0A8H6QWS7_9EURO|nr:hypothetical protein CNMCM7691_010080 [Aspergillus felis]
MAALLFRLVGLVYISLFSLAAGAACRDECIGGCGEDLILYMTVQSQGVLTLSFNPSQSVDDSIRILATNTDAGYSPGWITQYKENFYSVSRTQYPTLSSVDGGVFAFHKREGNARHSNLDLLNSVSSGGRGAVYVDVSRDGRTISIANIDGSTVSIHPRGEDGTIKGASHVFHYTLDYPGPGTNGSQIQSNPHEAIFDPSGEFLFVADRGADRLYIYQVADPFTVTIIQTLHLEPGTGPRHMTFRTFNETRTYMYLVSELDNSVRVFTLDGVRNDEGLEFGAGGPRNLTIHLVQRISTLGANLGRTPPNNRNLASEIALSNDGQFAYAANRNTVNLDSDTVAIYSVHPLLDDDRNHLTYLGYNITYGKTPRHFSLSNDPQSRFGAFGNEVTNNLVILERDVQLGFFTSIKGNLSVGKLDLTTNSGPTAVIWSSSDYIDHMF